MKEGNEAQNKEIQAIKNTGSFREDFTGDRFVELEPHRNSRTMQNGTSPRRSYMTFGGAPVIRMMP